jgi:arsenite oxidase large subunit
MMEERNVSIPIPPADAQKFQTCCKYCIVACGYHVYKWPVGKNGGKLPHQNAFNEDLRKGSFSNWISPTQYAVIRDKNDVSYNIAIVPDNHCVVNSGLYSVRGGTLGMSVYSEKLLTKNRLKHPLIVHHGQQEASWDDSIALVAGVTKELLDQHGPDAIGVKFSDHGGEGGGYEFTWSTGKFFYQSIKTTMATVHNRPTVFGEPMASRDMGIPELNIAYEDGEIADTIVIFGANPYGDQTNYYFNHMIPNLQGGTLAKKKKEYPGKVVAAAKMIVIDPRETITVVSARAAGGDANVLHLQVNPGTDVTLMNAIGRVILEHGWQDEAFIRDHVEADTYGPYKAGVGMHRPVSTVLADAEHVTGVPASQIRQAAAWIAEPIGGHRRATLFHYEKGAIWSIKNYPVIASYVDLAVLTGNLGKPGTGCARLGGHQEGYVRPDYPGKRPGVYVEKLLAEGKGPKLWWTIGCNPVQTAPDSSSVLKYMVERGAKVTRALDEGGTIDERIKRVVDAVNDGGLFIVSADIFPTETTKHAHVVFPAATQFEVNMTTINGERRLRLYQKFMDPPGEAKPDWQIMAMMAQKLQSLYQAENNADMAARFDGYDWQSDADVFRDASITSAKSRGGTGSTQLPENSKQTFDPEDISFLDHNYILALGNNGIQVPVNVVDGRRSGTTRLFTDGKFARPSGKTMFIVATQPALPPDVASQKRKYKYLVNNGRFDNMWQTGYETWRVGPVAQRWGDRDGSFIEINAADAAHLGVQSGDIVRVHNDYGSITSVVYISKAVKPGQTFMMFGQPNRSQAGFVVTPNIDPETNIPSYKLTYANIEKVANRPSSLSQTTFKDLEVAFNS